MKSIESEGGNRKRIIGGVGRKKEAKLKNPKDDDNDDSKERKGREQASPFRTNRGKMAISCYFLAQGPVCMFCTGTLLINK